MTTPGNVLFFADSAYPANMPHDLNGAKGLCFYAGGDTPHVWTRDEIFSFPAEYLLPIWVRSNPQQVDPVHDANQFVNVLKNYYAVPQGCIVALDSETSIDAAWVKTFVTILNQNSFPVIDYGSSSSIFSNNNPDGYYWVADPTGSVHIYPRSQMTQYLWARNFDESEALATLPFLHIRKDTPMYIVLPGIPGKWLTYQFNVDARGTEYVTGLGTTGRMYVTSKPLGGKWTPPAVMA